MMLAQKARAVLQALGTVLVVAPVPDAREERVALVAGAVVDLHGVEPGLEGALRRRRPEVDLLVDLVPRERAAGQEVRARQLVLRQGRRALDVAHGEVAGQQAGGVPGACVLQLDRHRAPVLVDRRREAREALDEPVVVEVQLHALVRAVGVVVHVLDGQRVLDAAGLHDDHAHAAARQTLVVGDHALADRLVRRLHERRAVGGLDDPVPRRDRADGARLEQEPPRVVSAASLAWSQLRSAQLCVQTANDRDASSRAGVIVMMPSAMRRSNSAHTAAGSAVDLVHRR